MGHDVGEINSVEHHAAFLSLSCLEVGLPQSASYETPSLSAIACSISKERPLPATIADTVGCVTPFSLAMSVIVTPQSTNIAFNLLRSLIIALSIFMNIMYASIDIAGQL